ncbi:uncharacterized protein LOC111620226 isoform X2 [Centruroides sculpturatus]|nr:uncharacterized protein LOC111620226 isoform X2 [Centruroides sculpturatus]
MTTEEQKVPYYKGFSPEMRHIYGKSLERIPYFQQLKERESDEKGLGRNYETKNIFQVIIPSVRFIPGYTGHLPGKNDVFGKTFSQQVEECLNNLAKIRKMNEERMKMLEESSNGFDKQYQKMERPSSSPNKDLLDKRSLTPQRLQEFRPEADDQFTNYPPSNNYIEPDRSDLYKFDRQNLRTERPKTCSRFNYNNRADRNPDELFKELRYESPFSQKLQKDYSKFDISKHDFGSKSPNYTKDPEIYRPTPESRMRYSSVDNYRDYKEDKNINMIEKYSGCNPDVNENQECNYRKSNPIKCTQSSDELSTVKESKDLTGEKAINQSYDFNDHHEKDYKPQIDPQNQSDKNLEDNEKSLGVSNHKDQMNDVESYAIQDLPDPQLAHKRNQDYIQNNPQLSSPNEQMENHLLKESSMPNGFKENLDSSVIVSDRRPSTGFYRYPTGVTDKISRYINWNDYINSKGLNLRRPNFYRTTYDDFNNTARHFNSTLNPHVFGNRGYSSRLNSTSYLGIPPMDNVKL